MPQSRWVRFSMVVRRDYSTVQLYADGVDIYTAALRLDYVKSMPQELIWVG
jgi:hypothetical protein